MYYFDFACVLSNIKEASDVPFEKVLEIVFRNAA